VPLPSLLRLKAQLVAAGSRVRLVPRQKNLRTLFDALTADGFHRVAFVGAATQTVSDLEFKELGN